MCFLFFNITIVAIVLFSLSGTIISNSAFEIALQAKTRNTETKNEVLEICPEPRYLTEKNPETVRESTNNNSSRLKDKLYDWD